MQREAFPQKGKGEEGRLRDWERQLPLSTQSYNSNCSTQLLWASQVQAQLLVSAVTKQTGRGKAFLPFPRLRIHSKFSYMAHLSYTPFPTGVSSLVPNLGAHASLGQPDGLLSFIFHTHAITPRSGDLNLQLGRKAFVNTKTNPLVFSGESVVKRVK